MVSQRNGVADWWFVLMAKTETEWWTNWVVCSWAGQENKWKITTGYDLKDIQTCQTLTKVNTDGECVSNTGECKYTTTSELRYILLY